MRNNNPFTLTFGKVPAEYISRYENMERVVSTFGAENPVSQTYLIEGIRGSGKTVLMTAISNELKENDDWVVLDINPAFDILEDMASRIEMECNKIPNFLDSGFNVSVAGVGIGVNARERINRSIGIIDSYLSLCKKKKRKVLVTIDEVMPGDSMRAFASEFQMMIRKDYPVFLLMAGLYENVYALQNDDALTFLLRTPKINLEPLSIHQIIKQYKSVFELDNETATRLAAITKGYAFAFQALGMLYYEHRNECTLDEIVLKLDDLLDDFVYRKIWTSLSEQDRRIVQEIGDNTVKVSELCKRLDMKSSTFSKYRERLYRKGILDTSRHGFVSLDLPRFSIVAKSYE